MISKELAKAVLSGEYKKAYYSDGEVIACNMNIYELAHKCKEWAFENYSSIKVIETKDRLRIILPLVEFDSGVKKALEYDLLPFDERMKVWDKACQWIMENKND